MRPLISDFWFSRDYLSSLSLSLRSSYENALPFKHVVIDDFLPESIALKIADDYPSYDHPCWKLWGPGAANHSSNPQVEKLGCSDENFFPSSIRHIITQFNSSLFLRFLEDLSGIKHLIPDPSFNGCGLHSTGRGGRLMVHADHNRYVVPNLLHQHINIIYYCTPDWDSSWGGGLELWSSDKKTCIKTVDPLFNRLLIFDTGRYSFHGHPSPLTCPDFVRRNSLASYFYVHSRQSSPNYTGFQDIDWVRTVPEDYHSYISYYKWKFRQFAKHFVPHSAVDLYRRMKRRL